MFKTRLLSGIVLVIAALVLIITGGDVLLVSTLLISWIGMFELYRIFHIEKSAPGIVGYATAAVYYANLRFGFLPDLMMLVLGLLIVLMVRVCVHLPEVSDGAAARRIFRRVLCGSDAVLRVPDQNA